MREIEGITEENTGFRNTRSQFSGQLLPGLVRNRMLPAGSVAPGLHALRTRNIMLHRTLDF
jgi:hypothetical protein